MVAKETIELAFLAAIQHLPATQRAVLILRDVLGYSARETADLLDTSVAAANSALQRARATLRQRLPGRAEWSREASAEEERLLRRYIDIHERADADAFAALLSADATFAMPPEPTWVVGREEIMRYLVANGFGSVERFGELRLVPLRANRQPGAANYVRAPGDTEFRAMALDVLRFQDGRIVEMTAFSPDLFAAFGLPPTLYPAARAQSLKIRQAPHIRRDWPSGELVHARIVRVVHEVLDRVVTGLRAGVPVDAVERRLGLVGRVEDLVARPLAAVLERMEERQPVPDLVRAGVALVIGGGVAAGQRPRKQDNPVENRVHGFVGVVRPPSRGGAIWPT